MGKNGNNTACSQTAGSAIGCELMVYDISSSTNPVYIAGRDASGNTAGTTSIVTNSQVIKGNYLFAAKSGGTTACSQTTGTTGASHCELQVYDISDPTNPVYVAGRDADGSAAGTKNNVFNKLIIKDNHLFVAIYGNSTACSQTTGSAEGCELQVYDISNPANPTYVAGRDVSGSTNGTNGSNFGTYFSSLAISGDYLFVGLSKAYQVCSQDVGFAQGCSFQIYNISNPANPTYVAGQDAGGGESGAVSSFGHVYNIAVFNHYIFVSMFSNDNETCSQTAGEADSCEIQVYDISSSTKPIYVKGMDISGDEEGVDVGSVGSMLFSNNHLFLGKQGNTTACSQVAGSALGCELQVYSFATFLNHSTSFTISQTINEEISLSLINPVTFDAIPGLSGGSSFNSTGFSVATNNLTGYQASLSFSTSTALQRVGGEGYINNYLPQSSTTPDYNLETPIGSHAFAFNVSGVNDVAPLFKNNGTTCGVGNNSSNVRCWFNQIDATIPVTIANRSTANPLGSAFTLSFYVSVAPNPSPVLPEGMYQATATITVLPN